MTTSDADVGRPREWCRQCGFDSDLYDRADTSTSQRIIPAVLKAAIEGLDDMTLHNRPDTDRWSIAEHLDHVREAAFGHRIFIDTVIASPGIDLGESPVGVLAVELGVVDTDAMLKRLFDEFDALQSTLEALEPDAWNTSCTLDGEELTVGWFARHVLHDALHHLAAIGRVRAAAGHGARPQVGSLDGIHVSAGGVPKSGVDAASISAAGVRGDRQNDRRHHGRPVQAVCLWSADVIGELAAAGHPIHAGAAGENLTLRGVEWSRLRPGTRIDVGALELLISAHAIPCAKNAQWFSDRNFNRIHHERHPGWSRLYAIPLNSATVSIGDRVVVEP